MIILPRKTNTKEISCTVSENTHTKKKTDSRYSEFWLLYTYNSCSNCGKIWVISEFIDLLLIEVYKINEYQLSRVRMKKNSFMKNYCLKFLFTNRRIRDYKLLKILKRWGLWSGDLYMVGLDKKNHWAKVNRFDYSSENYFSKFITL